MYQMEMPPTGDSTLCWRIQVSITTSTGPRTCAHRRYVRMDAARDALSSRGLGWRVVARLKCGNCNYAIFIRILVHSVGPCLCRNVVEHRCTSLHLPRLHQSRQQAQLLMWFLLCMRMCTFLIQAYFYG